MRKQLRLRAAVAVCLVGLTNAACDSGLPTDPGRSASHPSSEPTYSAGSSGGSYSIPIPSDNTRDWGRVNWTPTSIVVAPGAKVRVRVMGTVSLSANPVYMMKACIWEMPPGYCPPKFSGKSVGPGGILDHDYLALKVSVRVNSGAGVEYVPLVYSPDGMSAEAVYTTLGGTFEVYRSGVVAGYGDIDGSVGAYLMSGDQKLVVEPADGGGDTCSTSAFGAAGSDAASTDDGCEDDPEEDKPKLVLECNGVEGSVQLTRGDNIVCEAKKKPATDPGGITIAGWTFNGEERKDGAVQSTQWEGLMVTEGTITVRGRVGDGPEEPSSVRISIDSRKWDRLAHPTAPPGWDVDRAMEHLESADPVYAGADGHDVYPPGGLGVNELSMKSAGRRHISSGPNTHWNYFSSPPSDLSSHVWISSILMPDDPFYQRQTGRGRSPNGQRHCGPRDMEKLREDVLAHEGAKDNGELNHHTFGNQYFQKVDVAAKFEEFVFHQDDKDVRQLLLAWEAAESQVFWSDWEAQHKLVVDGQDKYMVPRPSCTMQY